MTQREGGCEVSPVDHRSRKAWMAKIREEKGETREGERERDTERREDGNVTDAQTGPVESLPPPTTSQQSAINNVGASGWLWNTSHPEHGRPSRPSIGHLPSLMEVIQCRRPCRSFPAFRVDHYDGSRRFYNLKSPPFNNKSKTVEIRPTDPPNSSMAVPGIAIDGASKNTRFGGVVYS
ncbi:uncharacterized protein BO80DRAFT_218326 [Aspergillus ibericus CBS 121593]|uniref:Uncharacterized protein n=1 Tax=Aspergillus ibericus CBS 121593 TaxID=1448316 RepID=A0A395GMG3_9EURO|nr:hypothetical protein BO80DRAFT_218326 [Aspergillus ibericus CBS 121593]RAK96700.1 hypothetical protein BO80DRAFT_218326 [Aspergillus ibericus CBS 121593]